MKLPLSYVTARTFHTVEVVRLMIVLRTSRQRHRETAAEDVQWAYSFGYEGAFPMHPLFNEDEVVELLVSRTRVALTAKIDDWYWGELLPHVPDEVVSYLRHLARNALRESYDTMPVPPPAMDSDD